MKIFEFDCILPWKSLVDNFNILSVSKNNFKKLQEFLNYSNFKKYILPMSYSIRLSLVCNNNLF